MLSFLGGEAVALGVIWWIVGLAALAGIVARLIRRRRAAAPPTTGQQARPRFSGDRTGIIYLLCLWGVIWCACLAASVLGETEANWMVPGYIALVVLIAAAGRPFSARGGWRARAMRCRVVFLARGGDLPSITRSGSIPRSRAGSLPRPIAGRPRFGSLSRPRDCAGIKSLARAVAEKVRAAAGTR